MMLLSRLFRKKGRFRVWIALLILTGFSYAHAQESLPASRCSVTMQDRILRVEENIFHLQSGLSIRLADIRLPSSNPERDQALAFLQSLRGRDVNIGLSSSKPGRWNNSDADLILKEAGVPVSWALVDAGLALVDLGEMNALCRPGLLDVEDKARRDKRGVWQNPQSLMLSAQDEKALKDATDRFVLVEGTVRSIAHRARTSYMNLGSDIRRHVTLVIFDPLRRQHLEQMKEIKGKTVRMRGILSTEPGPRLILHSFELVELVKADEIMFVPKR
jgi:hypothetical protein